ncbi:hypothetical protein DM01DRAFT_1341041, partial [Hesseltinella vesiculosa]
MKNWLHHMKRRSDSSDTSGSPLDRVTKRLRAHHLPNASHFLPKHQRSLNIEYANEDDLLPHFNVSFEDSLRLKNKGRNDIMIMDSSGLDDDERTLMHYLRQAVQNDPLTKGMREHFVDSFVNYLLYELKFHKHPFIMNIQPDYYFRVENHEVTAKVEFSIEKQEAIKDEVKRLVLCFDEDKHLHNLSSNNNYGECQIAAEILACAYTNYDRADSLTQGQDQTIFAVHVIGFRFTLYKAHVTKEYMRSLSEGFPSETLRVLRYPSDEVHRYGYDYTDAKERVLVLQMLLNLRETMKL